MKCLCNPQTPQLINPDCPEHGIDLIKYHTVQLMRELVRGIRDHRSPLKEVNYLVDGLRFVLTFPYDELDYEVVIKPKS